MNNEQHEISENISLKDVATQELISLLEKGKSLRVDIDSAKTSTKRQYLHKKLNKINTEATRMLVALETLDGIDLQRQESDVTTNEDALEESLNQLNNANEGVIDE